MLTFYANPVSPFATKVHYFLEEAGLPYTYHAVDMRNQKSKDELAEVNIFGKVPAIDLGGFKLGESSAIMRYLTARFERHSLLPLNLEDRSRVDALHDFSQNHVAKHLLTLAWNHYWVTKIGMKADARAVEEATSVLPLMLQRLDRAIEGRTFLAGPELTLADIGLAPFIAQTGHAQVSLSDYPHLHAWQGRLLQRPAWKKVAADLERRLALVFAK